MGKFIADSEADDVALAACHGQTADDDRRDAVQVGAVALVGLRHVALRDVQKRGETRAGAGDHEGDRARLLDVDAG